MVVFPADPGHVRAGLHQRAGPRPGRVGHHARGGRAVGDHHPAGLCGDVVGILGPSRGSCAMSRPNLLALVATVAGLSLLLASCGDKPEPSQYGANPTLPKPQRGLLPSMVIADPGEWGERRPVVPDGYRITAIATDLKIPRQTLVLPNGDILVAECRGGNAAKLKPKDIVAVPIKAAGNTSFKVGNRLSHIGTSPV